MLYLWETPARNCLPLIPSTPHVQTCPYSTAPQAACNCANGGQVVCTFATVAALREGPTSVWHLQAAPKVSVL
jgi:hypothetical protein